MLFSLFSFKAQKGDRVFLYKIVLDILNKYGKLEIKEQRAKGKGQGFKNRPKTQLTALSTILS